jgi:hypothetical protein
MALDRSSESPASLVFRLILWQVKDEAALVYYGINSFSALYILHRFGSILQLAENTDEDERMKVLGPIIGETFMVRSPSRLISRTEYFPAPL